MYKRQPYFGAAVKHWYVDLGVPFTYANGPKAGQVRGTITVSFRCQDFGELIHKLSLGRTGFGIITSPKGVFLAHPDPDHVGKTSVNDWIKESEQHPDFVQACESLVKRESGIVDYHRVEDRARSLFCYDQIPESGWGIGMSFLEDDLLSDQRSVTRRYIHMSLLLSLIHI